jgi:hypothetical protein
MPSPTPLLGFTLPDNGTLAGTWGDVVNYQVTTLVDSAIAGTTTLSTDADVTLTATTGATNQARQAILLCTGSRAAIRTITAPASSKTYSILNNTTGGFAVKLVGVGPTTGVTIANGETALVAWNGSDFVRIASTGGAVVATTLTVSSTATFANTATFTGNNPQLAIAPSSGSGSIDIKSFSSAGNAALNFFSSAPSTGVRWQIIKNNAAESGSNVGGDYNINRYSDTGSYLGTPFTIYRASGDTYITTTSPSPLTVNGTAAGGAVWNRVANISGSVNSQANLSLDPGNNGPGTRDFSIRAVNNGANQITTGFWTSNAAAPFEAFRITPAGAAQILGTPPAVGDNSTNVATTAYVDRQGVGGQGQVWTNVTGSRLPSTNYTNLTNRPIMVNVIRSSTGSSSFSLIVGGITVGNSNTTTASPQLAQSAVVPVGAAYSVTVSGCTITSWLELS